MTAPASPDRAPRRAPLVLIVDDDADLLDLESEVLTSRGYRVATATDGEQGLTRAMNDEPQLVLLDMRMPGMDGWAFAKAFRERYGRRIPIVVVTTTAESKLRADEIGADGHLGKPFELEQLYEIVDDTIVTEGS